MDRDGFVICEDATGAERDFIPCDKGGSARERVERGLAMRVDLNRFFFFDTRDREEGS